MFKALKSFSGVVSMAEGEVKDISDITIVNDLAKAGYIVEVQPAKAKEKPEEAKTEPVEGKKKKTAKE
jgi:hypothetical protein